MELCNTVYSICIADNTKLGVDTVGMKSVKYIGTGITFTVYSDSSTSPVLLQFGGIPGLSTHTDVITQYNWTA